MKRLAKIVVVIAVVLVGLYYTVMTPSVSLRYRLTVTVDVNGVTHTGSGVVQATYQSVRDWVIKTLPLDWASQLHGTMKGYAITVDLGDRGLLFVVNSIPFVTRAGGYLAMPGKTLDLLPFVAYRSLVSPGDPDFPASGPPSVVMDRAHMIRSAKPSPIGIPVKYLPMLVRFTNINDRSSIEEVDPRDLAAAMGPGAHLESVTFELTRDPVTPMPNIWPVWLKSQGRGQLYFANQQLWYNGIYISDFKGDS